MHYIFRYQYMYKKTHIFLNIISIKFFKYNINTIKLAHLAISRQSFIPS